MEEAEWLGAVEDDDERDRARGMPRSRSGRGGKERVVGGEWGLRVRVSPEWGYGGGEWGAGWAGLASPMASRAEAQRGGGVAFIFFCCFFILFCFILVTLYF